jgi:hypothetical protein
MTKTFTVTIDIDPKDHWGCGKNCSYLLNGTLSKCLLFAENVGSPLNPIRSRSCERFVSALEDKGISL